MGNTFGTPTQQFPLIDVRCVKEHRQRFRRDTFAELERANSYYSTAGRWPDIGWILLDHNSYSQLNTYATNLQLVLQDFINPPLTLSNLSITQARCVTRGIAADPNAIYLVQITNQEGILYNAWFQFPLYAQYNVMSPAYDGKYYLNTMNGSVAWTWDTMIGDIWGRVSSLLGTYPHLPITPLDTPRNFIFTGVPLWEALNRLLDYLGLAISGTNSAPTITVCGNADTNFSNQLIKYTPYLEDSMEYIDSGSGRVPSQVVVYFHTAYEFYGTEETVRRDSLQWQALPPNYSVTITGPSKFSKAAGTGYMWADYVVRVDMNGNPLPTDAGTAQAIAADRVTQYYNTLYRGTSGTFRNVYGGVLPFTTGSLVDGVRWFQTGMLGSRESLYGGWRTEIIRGYIWKELTFPTTLQGLTGNY